MLSVGLCGSEIVVAKSRPDEFEACKSDSFPNQKLY